MPLKLKFIFCLILLMGCSSCKEVPSKDGLEVHIREAKEFLLANDPQKAIKILEIHIRESNDHGGEITELLASAYHLIGDYELAAFYFEQAANLLDLKYYCNLKAAEIYETLGDHGRALSCYEQYLEILPNDTEIQIRYARLLLKNDQKKKALEVFIANAGDNVEVHNQIAALFWEFRNYIQSRDWYLSALRLKKNNETALRGLWKIYPLLRDWKTLKVTGDTLLTLGIKQIDNISVQNLMGDLEKMQKVLADLNRLEIKFDKVILPFFSTETEPVNGDSVIPETLVQEKSPIIKSQLATKPSRIEALRNELKGAKESGNFDEAIAILWKMLGLDCKNIDTWIDLTQCLLHINKYSIAEMTIQEVIKLRPDCVDFYLTYLGIVLRTHSNAEYICILKDIEQKFPENVEVCLLWAQAQEIYMANAENAKHSYEKFLKLAPAGHSKIPKVMEILRAYQHEGSNKR